MGGVGGGRRRIQHNNAPIINLTIPKNCAPCMAVIITPLELCLVARPPRAPNIPPIIIPFIVPPTM